MIISDLQHIESATETEVQGGDGRWRPRYRSSGGNRKEEDFDTDTKTVIYTDTLIIENQSTY